MNKPTFKRAKIHYLFQMTNKKHVFIFAFIKTKKGNPKIPFSYSSANDYPPICTRSKATQVRLASAFFKNSATDILLSLIYSCPSKVVSL